ncbi:hypothetical protein Tco_0455643 [Tanacetum coccineum]
MSLKCYSMRCVGFLDDRTRNSDSSDRHQLTQDIVESAEEDSSRNFSQLLLWTATSTASANFMSLDIAQRSVIQRYAVLEVAFDLCSEEMAP